jgi:hypothetical protein
MSAKYDLKHKKHPKILRPQIRKNYDVKKSAYSLQPIGKGRLQPLHPFHQVTLGSFDA